MAAEAQIGEHLRIVDRQQAINRFYLDRKLIRNGKVVYDLNGISRPDWETLPKDYTNTGDARWDAVTPARRPGARPPAQKK